MLRLLERARQFQKRQEQSVRATRLILEKNLVEEELSEYANLYDNWSDIPEGEYIKELTYIRFGDILYQCLQGEGHHKDVDMAPDTDITKFKVVNPRDLIPKWEQGTKYNKGDEVVHNNSVWKSSRIHSDIEPGTDDVWVVTIDV